MKENLKKFLTQKKNRRYGITGLLVLVLAIGGVWNHQNTNGKDSVQVTSLQVKVENNEKELESKQDKIDNLEAQNIQISAERDAAEEKLAECQKELSDSEKQADKASELNTKYASLQKKYDSVVSENETLKKQVKESNNTSASITTSNSSSSDDQTDDQTDNQGQMVHVTATGSKYHNAGCSYLRESDSTVTLAEAEAMGLTPCSRCH